MLPIFKTVTLKNAPGETQKKNLCNNNVKIE